MLGLNEGSSVGIANGLGEGDNDGFRVGISMVGAGDGLEDLNEDAFVTSAQQIALKMAVSGEH